MMKFPTAALACMALLACRVPETEPTAPNEPLVHQFFTHFNNHDWPRMAALYADSAEFKDPSFGPYAVMQSRAQTIAKYIALHETFLDIHDSIVHIYPSGSKHVIVEFISTGTAPDRTKLELPICTVFTFEKGKIVKDYTYYDNFEAE